MKTSVVVRSMLMSLLLCACSTTVEEGAVEVDAPVNLEVCVNEPACVQREFCDAEPGCVEVQPERAPTCQLSGAGGGAVRSGDSIAVYYTVQNFTLTPQGQCGGGTNCGHVLVQVQGCPGAKVESSSSPAVVPLGSCASASGGPLTVVILLHDDDHAVYVTQSSAIAAVTVVNVNVDGEHDDDDCERNGRGHANDDVKHGGKHCDED